MAEPRLRVRQTHVRPRSASPVGARHQLRFFEYAPDGAEAAVFRGPRRFPLRSRVRVRSLLAPLLPAGFPDSVTPDYLPFQLWDACQGLCSYIRGTVTTAALLRGVGVGSSDANPLSATAVYLARDTVGHAFGLAFGFLGAGKLDAEAKQWRFAADCANGVGYVLELLSPAAPKALFLPVVLAAAVLRAFTGVAAGATRAALTTHFARARNVADVSAKEGSQETAVTLLGMSLGYWYVYLAAGRSDAFQWVVFLAISALHLYANARAMRSLRLASLNRERLTLLVWHYEFSNQEILSVEEVAQRERLLPPLPHWMHRQRPRVPRIRLGTPLAELLVPGRYMADPADFAGAQRQLPLQLGGLLDDWTVCFAFHRHATEYDMAGALVRAVSAAARGRRGNEKDYAAALAHPRIDWDAFAALLRAKGWQLDRVQLSNDEGWRFDVR